MSKRNKGAISRNRLMSSLEKGALSALFLLQQSKALKLSMLQKNVCIIFTNIKNYTIFKQSRLHILNNLALMVALCPWGPSKQADDLTFP